MTAAPAPADSASGPAIAEYDVVTLSRALETPDGLLPAGARGAVVWVHGGGVAFEVEFHQPVQTEATVERVDLLA